MGENPGTIDISTHFIVLEGARCPNASGFRPNAVVFATSPIPLALREPVVNLDEVTRLGWGVALWLAYDDAEALCAALEASGTRIAQRPFDGPFGRTFSFVDPDGYLITVHGGK